MNQLTTRTNNAVALTTSVDDYYAALAAETQTYRGGGDGLNFLKFSGNDGFYSYGAQDDPLDIGTEVAINMMSFKRGWICWNNGKPVDEIMLSLSEGTPPAKHELPDHGPYLTKDDGWQEQKTIEFKTLSGELLTLLFQANNKSKMNALEALLKDFSRNYKSNPGTVPLTTLDSNEFEIQPKDEHGNLQRKVRKHAPKFVIHEWLPQEELDALLEGAPEDYDGSAEDTYEGETTEAEVYDAPAEEPAPAPAPRGGRREAPAAAAPAPAARPASRPAPAAAAPAARPAARPAPAQAPAAAAPARGRRF